MSLFKTKIILLSSCLSMLACVPTTANINSTQAEAAPKVKKDEPLKLEQDPKPVQKPVFTWPTESEEDLVVYAAAESLDLERPLVQTFIQKMVTEHGFEAEYITGVLAQSTNKLSILKAISRPAEKSKEWFEYRPIFLTDKRIDKGKEFIETHAVALQSAEETYGVPKEVITAIIGVETFYGRITGKYKVLDALVTLGFNYPPRAKFFRKELEEFFLLSREEGFDTTAVLGSYAGAMGNGQFISSSYRNWTADGDGDGKRDLWNSWPDAIHSVANYFSEHNWATNQAVITKAKLPKDLKASFGKTKVNLDDHTIGSLQDLGIIFETQLEREKPALIVVMQQEKNTDYYVAFNNFYTITRYNRSPMYALAVHQLSQKLSK